MAPGRAEYYLQVVANRDAADYYLAHGEEPGRWTGSGAARLRLRGQVSGEQLRAVLAGEDPSSEVQLAGHPARKVPGFDHTFRAPKSVSLLWALGDRDTAAQVVAAHDAAVDAAVGYLERAAGFTRRGAQGAESVEVNGFVAAAFRHRCSRAGDPLLHTHVLVANLAETVDDGVWRTLDSRRLFVHARTAGFLYQAQLRHELTARLGVGWQPVVNGHADIDGVDRDLIEAFSQRRTAILTELERRGESSAKAAQVATLTTRQAKDRRTCEAELRTTWRTRAATCGVGAGWQHRLTGRPSPQRPDIGALYRDLVDHEALTAQSSSFTRRDVIRAVAERLPAGAPVTAIEQIADAVIAHDPQQVIALGTSRGQLTALETIRRNDGRVIPADGHEARYTTRGLLLTEQRAVTRALALHRAQLAIVDDRHLTAVTRGRSLSSEQHTMVQRLTRSGAGVEIVVGKAGTGKTYALAAARHAWQTAGTPVAGVALAARAALELQQSAGIPSTTLTRLLGQLDQGQPTTLTPGSVLVVDEAGMVGTRQLARLLDHVEHHNLKIVLVGDPHQLPEIDAGGLFRTLTTRLPAIELTHNRRQRHPWEQAALDQLRNGDPQAAVTAYREHGRLVTADTAEEVRHQLIDDWWNTATNDLPGSIMIALRRSDVDDLNHRARSRMLTARRLTGPPLHSGGQSFQTGDRIVCLRNHPRLGVVNGTRATITAIDPTRRTIHATDDHDNHLQLPPDYLDAGHLTHGYAITGHKAQGLTVDHTYVLGSPDLYREWGYVAMSRGRESNQLYLAGADQLDDLHHTLEAEADQTAALPHRLQRSRGHQPLTDGLDQIAHQWRQLHQRLHAPDIARQRALTRRRAQLAAERQAALDQLERLRGRIDHTATGLGRIANRRQLADLRGDHDVHARQVPHLETQLGDIDAELVGLPTREQIVDLHALYQDRTEQLRHAAEQRVASVQHHSPSYLAAVLADPPQGRLRQPWHQAAIAIEEYRLRWNVTEPHRPLGAEPTDPLQREHRHRTAATIARFRDELTRDTTRAHNRGRSLSR
ncbi:MobF family relaxase [Nitriliruptor alkaliphilus]|uniref:MobF family relaxase n=1 Tax=Nitriliruptor alkaliphilus TaxID=427918 RepID=UPI0012ED02B8|nr:MobF family relaxase [Nitriliruptor alkaliphilus]